MTTGQDKRNLHDTYAAEAFMDTMMAYLESYEAFLGESLTKSTVNKHAELIGCFIEELCTVHTVTSLEQITRGMCGSMLVRSYNSNSGESMQPGTAKNILYRFLQFIADSRDIMVWPLLSKWKR